MLGQAEARVSCWRAWHSVAPAGAASAAHTPAAGAFGRQAARRDLAALAALGPAAEGAAAEALRELGAAQARGQAAERQAFQGMFHRPSELEPHRQ